MDIHEMELTQQDIVDSLRSELLSAKTEIKTLKEELRMKECLIQREREQSQARTNAYLDCLRTLTETKKEIKVFKKEVEVFREENASLKEMWNGLSSQKLQLEEEVQEMDKIIQRETEKAQLQTQAYMKSQGNLFSSFSFMEKELKDHKAQCDSLQEAHHLELSQVEETCRKNLEVLKEENTALKETVKRLTCLNAKTKDEVHLKQREKENMRVRYNAYINCLGTLTVR